MILIAFQLVYVRIFSTYYKEYVSLEEGSITKSEERRKQAASGVPFLWILSFRLHGCRR